MRTKKDSFAAFLNRSQDMFRNYTVEDKLEARILYDQLSIQIKIPLAAMPISDTLDSVTGNVRIISYW